MFALVFVSFLAAASAAPQWPEYRPRPHHPFQRYHHHENFEMKPFLGDGVFDTERFWSELSQEMSRFDEMMQTFMTYFPKTSSTAGVEGNQYKINVVLNGFEEKDIVVKAREGLVMVQASQTTEEGNQRTYMDVRTLPSNVNVKGSWTFEKGVLKIVFPLNEGSTDVLTEEVTTELATEAPKEREEIESQENENTNQDADVGVGRADAEILTNEIPDKDVEAVEATTYAVQERGGFDFVPVRY